MSSGHDEYWSGQQRANVEAARDAGVNLAFFSGNEVFWKTRWETSIDGSNTAYRTLVTYKDTHFDAPIDPTADVDRHVARPALQPAGRRRPARERADRPAASSVNAGTTDITGARGRTASCGSGATPRVANLDAGPDADARRRHDTSATSGTTTSTTASGPPGLIDLSSTTVERRRVVHRLRHRRRHRHRDPPPHAVPGAERRAGLRRRHRPVGLGPRQRPRRHRPPTGRSRRCSRRRSTCSPTWARSRRRCMAGLVARDRSRPTRRAPTSTITSPAAGATVADGTQVTITGTATDAGGGVVAGVEVSTDGGTTWHPATGHDHAGPTPGSRTARRPRPIKARATDDSGNIESPAAERRRSNVGCPCSLCGAERHAGDLDEQRRQRGRGRRASSRPTSTATITGVRFYKAAANTGTHIGNLWTASGTLLATGTFTGETAIGWQQVTSPRRWRSRPTRPTSPRYFAPKRPLLGVARPTTTCRARSGGNSLDSPPLHAISANGDAATACTPTAARRRSRRTRSTARTTRSTSSFVPEAAAGPAAALPARPPAPARRP